jgi:hypothetical protein
LANQLRHDPPPIESGPAMPIRKCPSGATPSRSADGSGVTDR